jgi:hypothetical protein
VGFQRSSNESWEPGLLFGVAELFETAVEAFAFKEPGWVTPDHGRESLASWASKEVEAERCDREKQKVSGNDENGDGHVHLMEDLQHEKKREEAPKCRSNGRA